jgi:hypothetical protein
MINVKKGTAHSLLQTDFRGTNPNPAAYGTGTPLYQGMLCYLNAGVTTAYPTTGGPTNCIKGFAINNSFDGDAIESKTIALYALDGASIIETDQVADASGGLASNSAAYTVGAPIYASGTTAGCVSITQGSGAYAVVLGYVTGIRFLQNATPYPVGLAATQSYVSATETAAYNAETVNNATGSNGQPIYTPTTGSYTFKPQVNVAVLGIKLAAL